MREWIPFYDGRWRNSESVLQMTMEERGVYITLLMWHPVHGSLPADLRTLARVTGVDLKTLERVWPTLERHFDACEINGQERLVNHMMCEAMDLYNKRCGRGRRRNVDASSDHRRTIDE